MAYLDDDKGDTAPPETIIGPSVKVEGELKSEGDIRVEGNVKGNVKTKHNLTIGEQAVIDASVEAQSATISGTVNGNVTVQDRLDLTETAKVNGDVNTKTLAIAAGAAFTGTSSMEGAPEGEATTTVEKEEETVTAPTARGRRHKR